MYVDLHLSDEITSQSFDKDPIPDLVALNDKKLNQFLTNRKI